MKKNCLAILFCLLTLPIMSQVTSIKSTNNRFEFIGENIMYDTQTKGYDLVVRSDNQFEDRSAFISLGKTQSEILTSFKNLGAALQKTKTHFNVAGYTIYVLEDPGDAYISNSGKLAHTAGIYHFTAPLLGSALIDLAKERNWSIGNVDIQVSMWGYTAFFDVILKDYNVSDYFDFSLSDYKVKFSDWFKAKEGDVLTPWQIAIIKSKIESGVIENDANAQKFQFLTKTVNVEEELKNAPQPLQPKNDNQPAYSGNCPEDGEVFVVVDKMPEFPNGHAALFKYIQDNIQYPQEAKEAGIQGRAICQFVVNTDGSICDVEVVRSTGNELLDSEAVRLIKNMPLWIPGMHRGEKVRVKYTIPFSFK